MSNLEVGDAFVLCKVEFLVFAVLLGHLKVAWLLDTQHAIDSVPV